MLGETVNSRHYIASTLMVAGSMLALTFTSKHSDTLDIVEIKRRLLSQVSLITIIISFALMAIFYILSFRIVSDIQRVVEFLSEKEAEECLLKSDNSGRHSSESTVGSDQEIEHDRIEKLKQTKEECMVHNPKWLSIPVFAFPWFAGLTSGMLALSAKCTMMLITHIAEEDNYTSFFTYVIFVSTPVFVLGEVLTLNLGLKYFDTCYVIPIFKASIVFHNTMCGGVLLQEFFHYRTLHISMYIVGILI